MNITHIHATDSEAFFHVSAITDEAALVIPVNRAGEPVGDAVNIRADQLVRVKEVEGYFGKPKLITRGEYAKRWADQVLEALHVVDHLEEFNEVKAMAERVRVLAGQKWDRIAG